MHPQHWPGPPIARCPAWAARPSRSVKYSAIDLGDNVDARFADTFTHPLCAGGALEPYRCRRSVCRRFHAVSWLVHHHVGHRPLHDRHHAWIVGDVGGITGIACQHALNDVDLVPLIHHDVVVHPPEQEVVGDRIARTDAHTSALPSI